MNSASSQKPLGVFDRTSSLGVWKDSRPDLSSAGSTDPMPAQNPLTEAGKRIWAYGKKNEQDFMLANKATLKIVQGEQPTEEELSALGRTSMVMGFMAGTLTDVSGLANAGGLGPMQFSKGDGVTYPNTPRVTDTPLDESLAETVFKNKGFSSGKKFPIQDLGPDGDYAEIMFGNK